MSVADILQKLSGLSPQERREIRARLNELDGFTDDEWDDDGELTSAEKSLIEQRLKNLDSDPDSSIPWDVAEARLKMRYGE